MNLNSFNFLEAIMGATDPTLLRRRLAAELRRLREQAGYTRDSAAKALGWSSSKMQYIESARFKRINQNDVRAMLEQYGVTERNEHEAFIALVRESKNRGWLQQYRDVLPSWFQAYVGLESEATNFKTYEPLLVPGLLQTEDYARVVTKAGLIDGSDDDVDRSVAARMSRQTLLEDNRRKFWIVLDEAALRRVIGCPEVMRDQLARLRDVELKANVTLQVLPYGAGAYPGMHGPFVILGFPDSRDRDVVYLDNETSSLYLEELEEVDRYLLVFDHMRAAALSIADSASLISQVEREIS